MNTNKREFTVIFSDKSKKGFTSDDVTYIYVKALFYLLGLKKDYTVIAIIDETNAKLYTDFVWDLSYSEKESDYLITSPPVYTGGDVERIVYSYIRYIGGNLELAQNWLESQKL